MTDNRPIGVFDSGLGGLTAVKQFFKLMPNEDIVYFGDTGRVPYGSRSRDTIRKYAAQDAAFLTSHNVKLVVAACGTVSSVAGDLGDRLSVPFTGVLRPTAQAAAAATKNGRVGVIGTTATIRSGAYQRELAAIDGTLNTFAQDCPLFVPLVESGFVEPGDPITRLTVERYLDPLKQAGVDTLILGCTHYPILIGVIQEVMGDRVQLIDSGRETALFCAKKMEESGTTAEPCRQGKHAFYVSDRTEGFAKIAGLFLGENIDHDVHHVDIDQLRWME